MIVVVSGVAGRVNSWVRLLISIHPKGVEGIRAERKHLGNSCWSLIKETEDHRGYRVAQVLWSQ